MAMRTKFIVLMVLGLAGFAAPALAQPRSGGWTGLTGQGERVEFTLDAVFIQRFDIRGRWQSGSCRGDLHFTFGSGTRLTGNSFVLDFNLGPETVHVEGSFVSPTLARGTLTANITGNCAGSVTTDWSAVPDGADGAGWPPSLPLTESESACDAARLSALAQRVSVDLPHGTKEASVVLSLTRTGDFAGLAYSDQAGFASPEHLLAFSTNPEETTFLRNPGRPQLFSFSATRNDLSSDLVAPGSPDEIRLTFNPTLSADPPPGNLLVLDNVRLPEGSPTAARPGRGLAELLVPCHGKLTDADVHIFRLLSRLLRIRVPGAMRYELVLFRGVEPHSYRIDIWAYEAGGSELGKIAAQVDVTYDSTGQLNRGTLRALGPCEGPEETDCTTLPVQGQVDIVTPAGAGETWANTESTVLAGNGRPAQSTGIDWLILLLETAWRQPL